MVSCMFWFLTWNLNPWELSTWVSRIEYQESSQEIIESCKFSCFIDPMKYYPVPGTLSVWMIEKAGRQRAGSGRERGGDGRACCFKNLLPVYQLLVYPPIGYFWQFISTSCLFVWRGWHLTWPAWYTCMILRSQNLLKRLEWSKERAWSIWPVDRSREKFAIFFRGHQFDGFRCYLHVASQSLTPL